MGRSVSVVVGTIPSAPRLGMVADTAGILDVISAALSTPPVADRGPVSFPSVAAAQASLSYLPTDANFVTWDSSWPVDRDLEDVLATLGANDILVLPERAEPYLVDSSEGFRAAGVGWVQGRNGLLPVANKYKGGRAARTWFAMARARRGILGLGPGAVIETTASSWTMEPQIEDLGSVQPDGWTSIGRFWYDTAGTKKSELVGCQEKVLESDHARPYWGNFTMRGRDFGGIAYSAIVPYGATLNTFERLNLSGAWRGFLDVPNGESGAIGLAGQYLISRCVVGTRNTSGVRVGSSPIMINSSSGGRVEHVYAGESRTGMATIWNSSGVHEWENVDLRWNQGPSLNLEKCQSGFTFRMIGGSLYSDYQGNGGKSGRPSDQGNGGKLHITLNAQVGSPVITLTGVDIDLGPDAGKLCIQGWGGSTATAGTITATNPAGQPIAVRLYQ